MRLNVIVYIGIVLLGGCTYPPQRSPSIAPLVAPIQHSALSSKATTPEHWITVFIHGTVGMNKSIAWRSFPKLAHDRIDKSLHQRVATRMRSTPFFFQNQAMQELGIRLVDLNDYSTDNGSALIARMYNKIYDFYYGNERINRYYTFGWSGLVSARARAIEAEHLFDGLQKITHEYIAEHGITPKIRLIGYSHGGNIALNLGAINIKRSCAAEFVVDELIAIGMPVQYETDYLVCQTFFKKVYNIYSRSDKVQKLDMFAPQRVLSRRDFASSRVAAPEKLTQIEIKVFTDEHTKLHPEHVCTKKCLRHIDRSPGHIELWSIGWHASKQASYREHFPLHPLPVMIFIPAIIATAENYAPEYRHLVLGMEPDHGTAYINKQGCFTKFHVPFLTAPFIKSLREVALKARPEGFTSQTYHGQVNTIFQLELGSKTVLKQQRGKSQCGAS